MTKKYYWAIAVAAAFVAGTMTTGGVVYASFDQCDDDIPHGISDGRPFLEIWQAICDLETQVDDVEDLANLGTYQATTTITVGSGLTGVVQAECDFKDIATGGGFISPLSGLLNPVSSFGINSLGNIASGASKVVGWEVIFVNNGGAPLDGKVFVICSDVTP